VIARYMPDDIAEIFSDLSRLQRWLDIEIAVCEGWVVSGVVPERALDDIRKATINAERIAELEAEQGHDLAAFVAGVQETIGENGRYLHLGVTSADVVDTCIATELRDAAQVIDTAAQELEEALCKTALAHRTTVMAGRTHSVHAEPITLGIKLANHFDEVRRSRQRLAVSAQEIAVGKIAGPVGTHSSVTPEVQDYVCQKLGLMVAPITTQVIARDRHAAFMNDIAVLGGVLERVALTIRLLQQTEIAELQEPFGQKQKGSSAMPHKRNPIAAERICGLARLLRGYALTAQENIALWHERDISHSSTERVIFADGCGLITFMLRQTTKLIAGMTIDAARMRENLNEGGGLMFSQSVLLALIDKGLAREDAYRTVQALTAAARETGETFRSLVENSPEIDKHLNKQEIAECFDEQRYLKYVDEIFMRVGIPVASKVEANVG
jgi:adenylosuccinate lyase